MTSSTDPFIFPENNNNIALDLQKKKKNAFPHLSMCAKWDVRWLLKFHSESTLLLILLGGFSQTQVDSDIKHIVLSPWNFILIQF